MRHRSVLVTAIGCVIVSSAYGDLPAVPPDVDETMIRFHGRGDVLRTVGRFEECETFRIPLSHDPGDAIHARLRIRLAPESEYEKVDKTNSGQHATGRVLWNQGHIGLNHYAGMAIGYRYDTDELYFVVGDSGDDTIDGDERVRVWRVDNINLDDGVFRTIDWGYDENTGLASCYIDGNYANPNEVVSANSSYSSGIPELNGRWCSSGSIGGGLRSNPFYDLADNGWSTVIGSRDAVWTTPNGPASAGGDGYWILDENTSMIGDVSYAAFRWATPQTDLAPVGGGGNEYHPWDVELLLNEPSDGDMPHDSAGGLDAILDPAVANSGTQELISGEHDTIKPAWINTAVDKVITDWTISESIITSEATQTRQLMLYHYGLGDQTVSVSELVKSTDGTYVEQELNRSLICCMGPDGEVVYWAIKSESGTKDPIIGTPSAGGEHSITLPAGKPGLYRFVVQSIKNEGFRFRTDQDSIYWGAYAPFGPLHGVDGLPATDVYAYVPNDSKTYNIESTTLTNVDAISSDGSVLGQLNLISNAGSVDFLANTELLAMDLAPGWKIDVQEFPLVLCSSEFAAKHYVKAGVTEMDGYTLWSPGDRALRDRIVKIVETPGTIGVPGGLGDHTQIREDFVAQGAHIQAAPRSYFSLGDYPQSLSSIHTALERQVTDPLSPMVGSIDHVLPAGGSGFLRYSDEPDSIYNFDLFGTSMMFWAGWDDVNANPYLGDIHFKRRARCAMLAFGRHVQGTRLRAKLGENGLHHGNLGLAGTDTFGMGLHWGRVYSLLDKDDREALLPAVVMQLCHVLNVTPTSTRNQDAHFLPFLYEAGKLWETETGSDMVLGIAEEYARLIVEAPNENVALVEATSYDGSYSGIQNYMLAAGWVVSGDDPFDPADATDREWYFLVADINRQYEFWSHFMVPPATGKQTVFGYDSGSRTATGAVDEQYQGAKSLGSISSIWAARLALQDGSDRANILLNDDNTQLATVVPLNQQTVWAENPRWRDEADGDKPLARDGSKFDLMPLYVGGGAHLFDSFGDPKPLDVNTTFASEKIITNEIQIEVVDDAYITVNTPYYYAVFSTRVPTSTHWYKEAFDMYKNERDIEAYVPASGEQGGGKIKEERYPDHPIEAKKTAGTRGEEIGGVGLSLFYDKTTPLPSPVIVGRNWTPLTTHQVIGYTQGGERRWAEQVERVVRCSWNPTLDITDPYYPLGLPVSVVIPNGPASWPHIKFSYEINKSLPAHGIYKAERTFTFYPDRVRVDVTLSKPVPDPPNPLTVYESIDRFVENIPIEMSEAAIGIGQRNIRTSNMQLLQLPWSGELWDTWCATNWTSMNQNPKNLGLQFDGQEIGWIQKEIPVPGGTPSTLSYFINTHNPPSSTLTTGSGPGAEFESIVEFVRAFEINDARADMNGDGEVTAADFQLFLDQRNRLEPASK